MKKKKILIVLAILLVLAGITIYLLRWRNERTIANTEAGFIASVKVERKQTGEDTVVSINNFWYKNSIVYTLDIKTFRDTDGDGVGDLKGLIQKLDYLRALGVDAIWLAPFQPSPQRDDGYDVTDYYGIDKRLGTAADFARLVNEAKKRGMRILMDLVVNHTSNEHPWFQQGRQPANPYHYWYVWSKEKPENVNQGMVFPGVQAATWTYDSSARSYYYHRFHAFQPDLNMQNDSVVTEVIRIVNFWLDKGVAGFRLDAVPFFIEVPQSKGEAFERRYELLTELRHVVQARRPDGIILGEANVLPAETEPFFGRNGNGLHLLFNFYVNQYLFYALATGDIRKLANALTATRDIPAQSQWVQFLRNDDEIDLGRLSNSERNRVYAAFGPDSSMQLYNRGIRRRLAPMFHNDRKKLELAYSMLMALPGTPVMRYGDEIGMGDDLSLRERESVRTPMQWSDSSQGGFTRSSKTVRPVIDTGVYRYQEVNVRRQLADSGSLLNWMTRMIQLRKTLPGLGKGAWKVVPSGSPHVLILQYDWEGQSMLTFHNFSDKPQEVEVKQQNKARTLSNMLRPEAVFITANAPYSYNLEGYGYRWYRIR